MQPILASRHPARVGLAGLAALALALLVAPVAAQETGTEPAEAPAEAPAEGQAAEADGAAAADLTADSVIARVGETEVTLGELIAVRQALPQQYQALPPEVLRDGLLEQLVNQTVLAVRAREEGLETRTDVALQLKNLTNSTLADSFMRSRLEAALTPEAVEAEYQRRYADAEPEEEINAAHILVDGREKAEGIREEILGGRDFADAAGEHGTDATKSRGGDLGWFVRSDMVPEFADAAFALETGVVSEPVETPFGWHLIIVMDRRDRAAPPLEEVRQEMLRVLAEEAQREILATAKSEVSVEMLEADFPPALLLADDLIAPPAE